MVNSILVNNQVTRDNLGRQDTTRTPLLIKFGENIAIEEGPTIIQSSFLNLSYLWNNTTWNSGRWQANKVGDIETFIILNPNNIFNEHFKFQYFIDTDNTTATIDMVTNKIK